LVRFTALFPFTPTPWRKAVGISAQRNFFLGLFGLSPSQRLVVWAFFRSVPRPVGRDTFPSENTKQPAVCVLLKQSATEEKISRARPPPLKINPQKENDPSTIFGSRKYMFGGSKHIFFFSV
jgi:hypothetical protein